MNFKVELDEFYMDDDSEDLESELKKHIINSVVYEIFKRIETRVKSEIIKAVEDQITATVGTTIQNYCTDYIKNGTMNSHYKETLVKDRVEQKIKQVIDTNSSYDQIKTIGKKIADELKIRYDRVFAQSLIISMQKAGLLKENSIATLLDDGSRKNEMQKGLGAK